MNNDASNDVSIRFLEKQRVLDGYLCVAEVYGNFNLIIDDLNNFLREKKSQLSKNGFLPEDCKTCFSVFGIERQSGGALLFFKVCCGMHDVFTVSEIKAHLYAETIRN